MLATFVAELPNLTGQHNKYTPMVVYLGVSHSSHPKRAEFQHSPILRVLLHIGPVSLMHNDQLDMVTHMDKDVF